jgi:hypothetical protein
MRVRTYGLLLLTLVGIAPLAAYGWVALASAEHTAAEQVREGNRRAARAIAGHIAAYADGERRLIAAIGAAVQHARDPHGRQLVLDAYDLDFPHLHDPVVYDRGGHVVAGAEPAEHGESYQDLARRALAGEHTQSRIEAMTDRGELFGHTITIGEPIMVAGKPEGAIVCRYDLVGIWPAVDPVRVGKNGVVRLLAHDGRLLAHGDPEERRYVFEKEAGLDRALVAGALLGQNVVNRQGDEIVAVVAFVPMFPAIVVVEQTVTEAFADVTTMERGLVLLAVLALVLALALGLAFGRKLVQPLEILRTHARGLANDLQRKVSLNTGLLEVRALADAAHHVRPRGRGPGARSQDADRGGAQRGRAQHRAPGRSHGPAPARPHPAARPAPPQALRR